MKRLRVLLGALVAFPSALALCLVRDGIDHLLGRYRPGVASPWSNRKRNP